MWTRPVGTTGEATSLKVSNPRRYGEVGSQVEAPSRTEPIMGRRNANGQEKRMTRGNGTKNLQERLPPTPKSDRFSVDITGPRLGRSRGPIRLPGSPDRACRKLPALTVR